MTVERRRFVRKAVGGNAEITAVHGEGELPTDRATILDCSRGGALLRVPAPKRRLLQKARTLQPQDAITCVLRIPPGYQDMEVFAEVVRVLPVGDAFNVGVRFFYDVQRRSHTDKSMRGLISALGVAGLSSDSHDLSALLPKPSPVSEALAKPIKRLKKPSVRTKKTSARLGKSDGASKRVQKTSARMKKSDAAPVRKSRDSSRVHKVTLKHRSSSSAERIPERRPSHSPIYFGLAGPESGLYLRGRGELRDGRATIEFPDHYASSIDPSTITVHLTPCGECCGLYVAKKSATRVVVLELRQGKSDLSFDYMLVAQRRRD